MAFRYYNPNPCGLKVGDCAIRALCKATDKPWEEIYADLAVLGFQMCDMPSANSVWGAYLRRQGFYRENIADKCPECNTLEKFCDKHPKGLFVVAVKSHVVTVKDGNIYDTWNSGTEAPLYYFRRNER